VALNELEAKRVENAVAAYVQKRRPPPHIRPKLDLGYRLSGQSVELFEIRPMFQKPSVKQEHGFAKATYVRTRDHWNVFWMRQDLKWHAYQPHPVAKNIAEFLSVVEKDEHHCFYG
jgi:Protein of unknown function (DUF3024)